MKERKFIIGKIDTITKEYIENPIVFADAFNQFLYHGSQKIDPARLTELDTTEIVVPYGGGSAGVPEQKYRDVLKLLYAMTDGDTAYCVMGIENQADIHYALPVRNGVYDFLQLSHQVNKAANSHKRAMKEKEPEAGQSAQTKKEDVPTDGEFLSGFWRTDRLVPVITLVIYFGSNDWDAPLSLKEMYSKDKVKLDEIIKKDSNFQNVERQAADVINVVTGSKLKYPEGKGDVNMCLAIQQMREESELVGQIKGAVLMSKNLGASLADTIKQIAEMFHLSESESNETVKQYW